MLNATDVVNEIRKVAAEQPDFIYNGDTFPIECLYTKNADGSPGGCIVGRALMRLNVEEEVLVKNDGRGASGVLSELGIGGDIFVMHWINEVQEIQDSGKTWAEAVQSADTYYRVAANETV